MRGQFQQILHSDWFLELAEFSHPDRYSRSLSFGRGSRVEGPMSRVILFTKWQFFFSESQIFSFKFFTRLWKTTTLKTTFLASFVLLFLYVAVLGLGRVVAKARVMEFWLHSFPVLLTDPNEEYSLPSIKHERVLNTNYRRWELLKHTEIYGFFLLSVGNFAVKKTVCEICDLNYHSSSANLLGFAMSRAEKYL